MSEWQTPANISALRIHFRIHNRLTIKMVLYGHNWQNKGVKGKSEIFNSLHIINYRPLFHEVFIFILFFYFVTGMKFH